MLLALFLQVTFGQTGSEADSLLKVLRSVEPGDARTRFDLTEKLYNIYKVDNLPGAMRIAGEHYSLAGKVNDKVQKAQAAAWMGNIYYVRGVNDSSLIFLNESLSAYKDIGDQKSIAEVKNNIANVFRVTAKYDTAMVIYTDLLKYYESTGDKAMQGKLLGNIGSLYYTAGNQEKAKEYTLNSLEIQRATGDMKGAAVSLVNLTVFALNSSNYAEGIKYGDEALAILRETDRNYYAAALVRVGYCYYMTGEKDKALSYTAEAIEINKNNNNIRGMMEAYRTQGDYLIEMGRYGEAREYGLEALQVADSTNRLDIRLLYDLLKRAAIYLKNPEEALFYSQEQIRMKEEDLNKEWADKIAEADAKYNVEKKELEISRLQAEKRTNMILFVSLLIIVAALSITGYFVLKSNKQKQLLAAQRIKELEQENQIAASNALLEGETAERARLSRDLHDGLGGLLSVAKLKIANMKGNLTIPEEHVASFNTAIDLLDSSIKELRRVAHNLMPESLMKFGLNTALAEFCRSTEKVTYHFFGTDRRLDNRLEVAVYRIVNELINNSLKHSGASEMNVQLLIDGERVNVVVEDNGVGFDPVSVEKSGGNGLRNIRSRVSSLDGKLDLITAPGKGTEVNVEFKI